MNSRRVLILVIILQADDQNASLIPGQKHITATGIQYLCNGFTYFFMFADGISLSTELLLYLSR